MDEEKKKISFIINPKSGTQSKEQILHLLDEKLDKTKYAQEVIYTEYAGHAVEIAAQKAKENVHAVVAIGGDGTINAGAYKNCIGHHSVWFGKRTCTPPANFDGA
jgi:diacylglycerol kinase (ATP)